MIIYQDDELFYRLLTEGIVQLSAIGEVYVSDALKKCGFCRRPAYPLEFPWAVTCWS